MFKDLSEILLQEKTSKMKDIIIFSLLLLFVSCKKESHDKIKTPIAKNEVITPKVISEKADTIGISGNDTKINYILAYPLEKQIDKDSTGTINYRLDFYINKVKIGSEKTTNPYTKGADWSASYGLSANEDSTISPFIQINFGYGACGYIQKEYLFYLTDKKVQLVHQWESSSDSGWGSWVEFTNPSSKTNPESFYCKTVSFDPEDDNEDMGTVKHSDSIVFRLSGNQYKKQLLSAKDKTYFEKKMLFDDFYKQK